MSYQVHQGVLCAGTVSLADIARAVGTPTYVYSAQAIALRYAQLRRAFAAIPTDIYYAVKANANLAVLRFVKGLGAGFDIVSAGELQRCIAAGAAPETIVFSGVGKSVAEIDLGLKLGIGCFNVESAAELARRASREELLGQRAAGAGRMNPDVDAGAHPYISTGLKRNKFGVAARQAQEMLLQAHAHPHLRARGLACHIGSQIDQAAPYLSALQRLLECMDAVQAQGVVLDHIDIGGGFGVTYRDETPFDPAQLAAGVGRRLAGRCVRLAIEPGRYLTADAGVLLTEVEYLKPSQAAGQPNFAVVDAAMNDLLRPALYQAWHEVVLVQAPAAEARDACWDIVGPVCESGDFLAQRRQLALAPGDLLAVRCAGAYGMAQSSNYNSRGRAAEVLVRDGGFKLVRRREHIDDQLALERLGDV